MRWNKRLHWCHGATAIILILALAGCDQQGAKVYRIPKDDTTPPSQPEPAAPADSSSPSPDTSSPPPDSSMAAPASQPPLGYQLPEGWQEKSPTEMRVASFTATGPNGESADIGVIPLPIVGRDLELVNMWRSQVQLPPTTDPNAVNQAESVAIGPDQGRLFEFVSDKPMTGQSRQRILMAMDTRGSMSWFFKMAGEDAYVTAQKAKFIQFLKSVSFNDNAPAPMVESPAAPNDDAGSIWTVPSGWQPTPPAQFLLAEFSVPGANGAKAEVNVAELDGDGGGLLANVNRWRGQIGLTPVNDGDLAQLAQPLDVPAGKATQVDFTGIDPKTSQPTRLVGVVVSQNGQTWFYKLMGEKQVVAQQEDTFTKFIQSANYANAR